MKKLNKNELTAIARDISRKINAAAKLKHEEDSKAYEPTAKKLAKVIMKELNTLSKETKNMVIQHSPGREPTLKESDVVEYLFSRNVPWNHGYTHEFEIVDALIMAQIDSPDLKTLTETVTKQFTP